MIHRLKRPLPGKLRSKSRPATDSGQASLEVSLSLACALTILFGSLNIFLWMNKQIVERQEYYEHGPNDLKNETAGEAYGSKYSTGRVAAADGSTDDNKALLVNETRFYDDFDIFAKVE